MTSKPSDIAVWPSAPLTVQDLRVIHRVFFSFLVVVVEVCLAINENHKGWSSDNSGSKQGMSVGSPLAQVSGPRHF